MFMMFAGYDDMVRCRKVNNVRRKKNTLTAVNELFTSAKVGKKAHLKKGRRSNVIPRQRKMLMALLNLKCTRSVRHNNYHYFSEPTRRIITTVDEDSSQEQVVSKVKNVNLCNLLVN